MRTRETIAFILVLSVRMAAADAWDVRYGTFESPAGFTFQHTGTIDSFRGTLSRKSDGFTISFDIGYMAGLHMSESHRAKCVFYRTHKINGNLASTGIERVGDTQTITTTIYDQLANNKQAPANFWAAVKRDSDVAEFLLIVSSYKPKAP